MASHRTDLNQKLLSLGLVPTMGFLHKGHLSLIELLKGRCDQIAVSIFVNPLQFGLGEDLEKYPHDEKGDLELLERGGCDLVFIPRADDLYPKGYQTYIEVSEMTRTLCGLFRPEHFKGVTSIVLRLFTLTGCAFAAFGLKDYQQGVVIQKMVDDLFLPVELLFGETIREKDGLAMSSRNKYLSEEERMLAGRIHLSLEWAKKTCKAGETSIKILKNGVRDILLREPGIKIQYLELVDLRTLENVKEIKSPVQLMLAVHIGSTRLIDNTRLSIGK